MNVIESYLISIGATVDDPSFRKFKTVLDDAERTVASHTFGITKNIVEAQGAITGGFLGLAGSVAGIVDKVAMQDQAWRLLGLRYLMNTDQARKMDLVMKGLGATLEQIFWDPELRARAMQWSEDIDRWSQALGTGYEPAMKRLRDIHYSIREIGVAGQFLGMVFSEKLFQKLGLGDVADRLRGFINGLSPEKIDQWADVLSDKAVPVLKETWQILKDLGGVIEEGGVAFTNLVGLLSNDQSIQGTEFSFNNLLKAVEHVEHGFEDFLHFVTQAEMTLAHFASAVSLLFSGKFGEAKTEFTAGLQSLTAGAAAAIGTAVGGAFGGPVGAGLGAAAGAGVGDLVQKYVSRETSSTGNVPERIGGIPVADLDLLNRPLVELGTAVRAAGNRDVPSPVRPESFWSGATSGFRGFLDYLKSEREENITQAYIGAPWYEKFGADLGIGPVKKWEPSISAPTHIGTPTSPPTNEPARKIAQESSYTLGLQDFISSVASMEASSSGVDPALLRSFSLAVAKAESGFNPQAVNVNANKTTDYGLFQLNSANLGTWGVTKPFDVEQNTEAGVHHLAELLKRYHGDLGLAAAAYNAGESRADRIATGLAGMASLPTKTQAYVPKVLRYEKEFAAQQIASAKPTEQQAIALTGPANAQAMDYLQRAPEATSTTTNNTYQQQVTIGSIPVTVTAPGADEKAMKKITDDIVQRMRDQTQWDIVQTVPAY